MILELHTHPEYLGFLRMVVADSCQFPLDRRASSPPSWTLKPSGLARYLAHLTAVRRPELPQSACWRLTSSWGSLNDWIATGALSRVRSLNHPLWRRPGCLVAADRTDASTAIQTDLPAIFASLELSRSTWLITSLSPGAGEKISRHSDSGRRCGGLAHAVGPAQGESARAGGAGLSIIAIQEAGLDGFWIHRVLQSKGIESHVVDAASILTSRRRRRRRPTASMGRRWSVRF